MTAALKRALATYGHAAQINKTIEECTELSLALQHYRDGKATVEEVVDERVSFKLNRLTERMNERSPN